MGTLISNIHNLTYHDPSYYVWNYFGLADIQRHWKGNLVFSLMCYLCWLLYGVNSANLEAEISSAGQ
jgi:hypothetical protein